MSQTPPTPPRRPTGTFGHGEKPADTKSRRASPPKVTLTTPGVGRPTRKTFTRRSGLAWRTRWGNRRPGTWIGFEVVSVVSVDMEMTFGKLVDMINQ